MARNWRPAVLLAVAALILASCRADWTQFGFGAGNARSSSDLSINLANVDSLVRDWIGTTGAISSSSPAVAGGVAYVGSDDGTLYAFRADGSAGCTASPSTCSPLWTAPTGGAIASSPAVAEGLVFVGSDDGRLYAFDAEGSDGCAGTPKVCQPTWTAATGGPVASAPTVSGGVVYVGSGDGDLYAFDAVGTSRCAGSPLVCSPRWMASTGGAITSSPAVSNGSVFVGSADSLLYAFDADGADGCSGSPTACAPRWTATTGGAITASPAVAGGRVFVGSTDGKLYAFDAAGAEGCWGVPLICAPIWTVATGGPIASSPAVTTTDLYVGSDDGKLYAIDAFGSSRCSGEPRSCTPRWTGAVGSAVRSSPAVAGGVVFAASAGGDLTAFDAQGGLGCTSGPEVTCSPVWSASVGLDIGSSPVVSRGRVYVGSDEANLHVFRAIESTTPVPPVIVATPHAIPGDREVTVRWKPATRVDLPIAGYVVQPYRDGVAQPPITVDPDAPSYTVTGIDGNPSYTFTVAVKVADVIGPPSPLSDAEAPSDDLAPSAYQVNPAHDGYLPNDTLPAAPTVKWSKSFDSRVSYPVVADGRVFVTVGGNGAGAYGARLFAYDQATGTLLWGPVQLGGHYYISGLAYEDHKVYTQNHDGVLEAHDEVTGAVIWSTAMPGQYSFSGPPTAFRGVVYTGGSGDGSTMYAVDGATGEVLWTTKAGNGSSAAAVDATGAYVSSWCSGGSRLDLNTGAAQWPASPCFWDGYKNPVLAGGKLYVRQLSRGSIFFDAATGTFVDGFGSWTAPAVTPTLRYDVDIFDRTITAVRTSNGQTAWTTSGDGSLSSAPLVVGGVVVVGGANGSVFAFDAQTGASAWSKAVGATIESPSEGSGNLTGMAADRGRLFVSASSTLVALG